MKRVFVLIAVLAILCLSSGAFASLIVQTGELTGPTDWLADVRFRNFNSTISDYEMMVNADPNRTVGQNQVNGHVPGPYAFADWAQYNDFTIVYDPLANDGAGWVSLRLIGSGPRQLNSPGGYDVTIGRAPDAVTAGPVNYINFQLWDRGNFPTFNGLTISNLAGVNLGTFTLSEAGIGSWSILDPGGVNLNSGFTLQGSFTLDLEKLAEGRDGDKITFKVGHNPSAVPEPGTIVAAVGLLGPAALMFRRKRA